MPEILFIAIDPCILALVENLQQLVKPRIWLESDYTSGIKRIFDTRPAIVFLQHQIGAVGCDKLASQVKMLLEGSPVPMVLLSEESVTSYSVVSTYEACLDLCLPLEELSLQVQQLLRTLPEISWQEMAQQVPGLLPSGTPGEISGALPPETALQIDSPPSESALQIDSLPPETAGQVSDALPPETTMEITLPAAAADYMAFPWQESAAEIEAQFSPLGGATLEAFETNDVVGSDRFETSKEQEQQFRTEFLEDRFVSSPPPVGFDEGKRQDAAASCTAAPHNDSRSDLRRLEREDPRLVFEGLPESRQEPSPATAKPVGPRPGGKKPVPAAARSTSSFTKIGGNTSQAAPPRQEPPAGNQAQRTRAASPDELPESVAASLGIIKERPKYFRALIFGMLLIICIASLDLMFTLNHKPGPVSSPEIAGSGSNPKAPPAATRAATPQLPQFVPQVTPDPGYPASHPGWERYQADGLEYLVYREKGSLAAVQVLSQQPGAISPPFLKTCIRVSSGAEQFTIKKTEERSGIQITTGSLQNGGELVLYKAVPTGEIRGFVIAYPTAKGTSQTN
jgi:hypothetical protein